MKKFIDRKAFAIICLVIICLSIVACSKRKNEEVASNNTVVNKVNTVGYKIIKEEVQALKVEEAIPTSKYNVDSAEIEGDKLSVVIKGSLEDSAEAYKTVLFIKSQVQELNREQFQKKGIKNMEIIIKSDNKSWLYEKDGSIKEISFGK